MPLNRPSALAILALLLLSPLATGQLGGVNGEDRSMMPLAATKLERQPEPFGTWGAAPPSTDGIESSSGVDLWTTIWSVQRATTGWIQSVPYTVHEGRRWDYVAVLPALNNPGEASVTLTVFDPDGTPGGGFDGEVVQQVSSAAAGVVYLDLLEVDEDAHARLQVHILIDNSRAATRSSIVGWRIGDCDVDLWHDPFMDIGRHSSRGDLTFGLGSVYPVVEYKPGGIYGDYYRNRDFSGFEYTHLDPVIDFDWGNGGPTGVGSNTFSIRWTGKLNVVRAERFTFYLRIDDGGKLWVDDQLLIDEWRDHSPTEFSAQVDLGAGLHDIQVDYYENQGGALCELRYSSPTISKRIIPQSALYGVEADNVLLSEPITAPPGQTWELLLLSSYGLGKDGMVVVDVLDAASGQVLTGLDSIIEPAVDLRGLASASCPAIQLRARWVDVNVTDPPWLGDWAVKWAPSRTWRTQFLSDIGIRGHVGLVEGFGYIQRPRAQEDCSQIAFAERTDGLSTTVSSRVYSGWFEDDSVITTNASDVELVDLDFDGILDLLHVSAEVDASAYVYKGFSGGFKDVPMYTFAHDAALGGEGNFSKAVVWDLDLDGHEDVVLVEMGPPGARLLLYYWNGTGFNSTPDEVVGGFDGLIWDISVGDIDGDAYPDIVVIASGDMRNGLYVLWGSYGSYAIANSTRITDTTCSAVHVASLDEDEYDDIVYCSWRGPPGSTWRTTLLQGMGSRTGYGPGLTVHEPIRRVSIETIDWFGNGEPVLVLASDTDVSLHQSPFDAGAFRFLPFKGVVDMAPVRFGTDGNEDLVMAVEERAGVPGLDDYGTVSSWLQALVGGTVYYSFQIPTDGAVAVSAGDMFDRGVGALRTGRIDIGDPRVAGGWDELSFRLLGTGLRPGQSVELRVLDDETEEVLWNATSTSLEGVFDISQSIKAKEHPVVCLEAFLRNVEESQPLSMDELRINWTPRIPASPAVVNITADDPVIYRMNRTTLRITVDDEYDLPQDLSVVVQMDPPGNLGWQTTGLGTISWNGSVYMIEFSTSREFLTGDYGFRARATDTDMMTSAWLEATALVRVINNPPGTPVISIRPATPVTTDDIVCVIETQAYDRDGLSLDYIYAWSSDGVASPEHTGATVPASATVKGQKWSVAVRAFDGEAMGPPVRANVTVVNSPPVLLRPIAPILMYEDDPPVTVNLGVHFTDPDGDALAFSVEGLRNILVELDGAGGSARFSLSPEWSGQETATVAVTDGELSVQVLLDFEVRAVPDAPYVLSIGGRPAVSGLFSITARQDLLALFEVVVVDPDSTSFRFSADVLPGWVSIGPLNGTISVLAPNEGVGTHAFNLSVRDDTGEIVFVRVELTVENVNDPPGTVFINQPKNGKVFQASDSILMQGACSDPDERWGQPLTFTWYTNASTEPLGKGASVTLPKLSPGDHTIRLEVTDGQYVRSSEVRIRVLGPPVPPPPDGNGGEEPYVGPRTTDTVGPLLIALLLVLLVIVAAIAFVSRQRAARGRGWTAPPRQHRDEATRVDGEYGVPSMKGEAAGIRVEQPLPRAKAAPEPAPEPATEPAPEPEGAPQPSPMPDGWGLRQVPPSKGDESWEGWEEF